MAGSDSECFLLVSGGKQDKMSEKYTFEEFVKIIEMLRSENGCPWDREQTHESLRSCMMEEAAELLGAIRIYNQTGNAENMQEELGDILLQAVMHSVIAAEEGLFTIEDVIGGISKKMIRRHPHVFSGQNIEGTEALLENWEEIKKQEKEEKIEYSPVLPATSAQMRVYTSQFMSPDSTHYNISYIFNVEELDVKKLQNAVNQLISRHESLRTTFQNINGEIMQIINDSVSVEIQKLNSSNPTDFIKPFDLSKAVFIATANDLGGIPGPLRDRLEIIELSSYTEQEKLAIAKDHLYMKKLVEHGLKPEQFTVSDEAIMYMIRRHTREAGVRQLERLMASLIRKAVVKVLRDKVEAIHVDVENLEEYLGKPRFDYTDKLDEPQVGVVTGMAYTQFGGDILPIEVNHFEGTGKLIITGQLGDVMKESARAGISYIRSVGKEFEVSENFFEKHDIHIHIPEGATPKDGPSAGITMATAMLSAIIKKPVRADVAMTGEITLRGRVLPIGGLKEKVLAAKNAGIKTVCVPKKNEKDIDDIPEQVRSELTIVLASHIDTVLDNAICK